MTLIESMVPATEVYSIDECFADLTGIQENLTQFGRKLRSRIFQCTGIPVGVDIAGTKTLAKLANHTAKRLQAQTGGVVDITDPFRPGFRYSKAEVLLMDLRQPGEFSEDLFALKQSVACDRLMQVMDDINERWGRGTMRAASVPATSDWGMRREMMSQSAGQLADMLEFAEAARLWALIEDGEVA